MSPRLNHHTNYAFFQSETITGKVVDEAGLGMPGVNVVVKGTSVGTTTDAEGAYRLSVTTEQAAGTLVFSFIGYAAQEQPINNRSSINVSMVADISELTRSCCCRLWYAGKTSCYFRHFNSEGRGYRKHSSA